MLIFCYGEHCTPVTYASTFFGVLCPVKNEVYYVYNSYTRNEIHTWLHTNVGFTYRITRHCCCSIYKFAMVVVVRSEPYIRTPSYVNRYRPSKWEYGIYTDVTVVICHSSHMCVVWDALRCGVIRCNAMRYDNEWWFCYCSFGLLQPDKTFTDGFCLTFCRYCFLQIGFFSLKVYFWLF